jgi:hypothetical protein
MRMHGERRLCALDRIAYSPLVEGTRDTAFFATMV